jgi:diguanylate cyclase (GGDEF)-like protein
LTFFKENRDLRLRVLLYAAPKLPLGFPLEGQACDGVMRQDQMQLTRVQMKTNHPEVSGARRSTWRRCPAGTKRPALRNAGEAQQAHLLTRIRELEAENARLARLAITDELTGAYNRRFFESGFCLTSPDPEPFAHSLAFCLFDVDNFKAYNDLHGHAAGDDALRLIARAAKRQLRRDRDFLCRLGGDEFCMMISVESLAGAFHIIERVQHGIRELRLPNPDTCSGFLTISAGAIWRDARHAAVSPPGRLYLEADRILYQAKRRGRNRTELATL